jgi:hypothetical protein
MTGDILATAFMVLAGLLNLYQAYDWWRTTQTLKEALMNTQAQEKRYKQLSDAYQEVIMQRQRADHKTPDDGPKPLTNSIMR